MHFSICANKHEIAYSYYLLYIYYIYVYYILFKHRKYLNISLDARSTGGKKNNLVKSFLKMGKSSFSKKVLERCDTVPSIPKLYMQSKKADKVVKQTLILQRL